MDNAQQNGLCDVQRGPFDYNKEKTQTESSNAFLEMRNLLMMLVVPKRIHKKDCEQAAYLRATIVRVSIYVM